MKKTSRLRCVFALAISLLPVSGFAAERVVTVALPDASESRTRVARLEAPDDGALDVAASSWLPGSLSLPGDAVGAPRFDRVVTPLVSAAWLARPASRSFGLFAGFSFGGFGREGRAAFTGEPRPVSQELYVIGLRAGGELSPSIARWRYASAHAGAALLPTWLLARRWALGDSQSLWRAAGEAYLGAAFELKPWLGEGFDAAVNVDALATAGAFGGQDLASLGVRAGLRVAL